MPDSTTDTTDLGRAELIARIKKLRLEAKALRAATAASLKRAAADDAELVLRSEKSALDIQALRHQLSREARFFEKFKAVTGASGLLIAIAGGTGLFISSYQWLENTSLAQAAHQEERLDKVLQQLAEKTPALRLSAVASLQSFLGDTSSDRRERVLLAFSNQMVVDDSLTVRNAILATFDKYATADASGPELTRTVDSLVRANRGLVDEGDLWWTRRKNLYAQPKADSVEGRAQSIAEAIAILLRRGVKHRNFEGTYLGHIDLSGTSLGGASFDDAILASSDFTKASCRECTFRGADLSETQFVAADLRKTTFGAIDLAGTKRTKPRHDYIAMQFPRDMQAPPAVETANFECADLRGASFAGFPAFEFTGDAILGMTRVPNSIRLRYANIEGADFTHAAVYGLRPHGEQCNPVPLTTSVGASLENVDASEYRAEINELSYNGDSICKTGYESSYAWLVFAFSGTNIDKAILPNFIRVHISQQPVMPERDQSEMECEPRAPWSKTDASRASKSGSQ